MVYTLLTVGCIDILEWAWFSNLPNFIPKSNYNKPTNFILPFVEN